MSQWNQFADDLVQFLASFHSFVVLVWLLLLLPLLLWLLLLFSLLLPLLLLLRLLLFAVPLWSLLFSWFAHAPKEQKDATWISSNEAQSEFRQFCVDSMFLMS